MFRAGAVADVGTVGFVVFLVNLCKFIVKEKENRFRVRVCSFDCDIELECTAAQLQ